MRKFLLFSSVGAVGFAIDGGLLVLLSQMFDINLYVSRIFSFIVATIATWLLNRSLVFKVEAVSLASSRREYGRYFFIQSGGALINLGVFSLLIKMFQHLYQDPIIPLFVGALFGLLYNYTGVRYWAFKGSISNNRL